jgi:hypothetical protein
MRATCTHVIVAPSHSLGTMAAVQGSGTVRFFLQGARTHDELTMSSWSILQTCILERKQHGSRFCRGCLEWRREYLRPSTSSSAHHICWVLFGCSRHGSFLVKVTTAMMICHAPCMYQSSVKVNLGHVQSSSVTAMPFSGRNWASYRYGLSVIMGYDVFPWLALLRNTSPRMKGRTWWPI